MKWVGNIGGVILTLAGILWTLQGTNVLRGGAMGGQPQWAVFGIIIGVVGIALLVWTNRRAARPPEASAK